jgi:DNA-binding CsgD family transcriptional regulator
LERVKAARKAHKPQSTSQIERNHARSNTPSAYIFCDKKTGAVKFTVEADQNGDLPLDRIAGSLAVYCVAHYCSPKDLLVVVRADKTLTENVGARAVALLQSAGIGAAPVALSPREREVLHAVTSNLENKEIAFQLSISVRTVKFHVSALLAKFGVQTRSQLYDFSTARMYDAGDLKVAPTQNIAVKTK